MSNNCEVVIVGGGLVGSLCGIFLAKRGFQIRLYEAREDPRNRECSYGRSINLALSNRGRRALRVVGLEEEILKFAIPMKGRFIHSSNGRNSSILYDPNGKQSINSVSRNYLNQKLLDEVEKYPNVKLYFHHKVTDIDPKEGVLTIRKKNATMDVQTDLIIGADGAFSTVRRFMQQTSLFNFSQTYIDHGYIEMCVKPNLGTNMVPNHLHIWPRGQLMVIALPNIDDSWTVTLFMPFEHFERLNTPEKVVNFFKTTFPDTIDLFGGERSLVEDYFKTKPSVLVSIKCGSFHFGENLLLIGDAAHAMLPFYGQGMNAGFEDCHLLDAILENCENSLSLALQLFSEKRREDAHAICDLAMYNYREMRDLVIRPSYLARKKFDDFLFWLLPNSWIPLYNSVTFSEMSYQKCIDNRQWQDKVIQTLLVIISILLLIFVAYSIYVSFSH